MVIACAILWTVATVMWAWMIHTRYYNNLPIKWWMYPAFFINFGFASTYIYNLWIIYHG